MASPAQIPNDQVVVPAPGSGFDLVILSMYEKPGWLSRTPGSQTRVPHPGTAVEYQGQVYEVIDINPATGSRYTYRYALRKWEERFTIRRIVEYTPVTERKMAQQVQEHRARHRRHSWLIYTFPLSTWLPSPMLQRWSREWGLPMYGLSIVSGMMFALPLMVAGIDFLFYTDPPAKTAAVISFFIAMEQGVRVIWIFLSREAQGSLVVTALWKIFNPRDGEVRTPKDYLSPAFADEVRYLKEQPWDAEVRTIFRDPLLLGEQPVLIEGQVYQPLGYIQQGVGLQRRYIFRLKQLDSAKQAKREYHRHRSQETLAALVSYETRRDHIRNWAPLYGFLPSKVQLELEREYDFLGAQASSLSALLMLGAAGLKLIFGAHSAIDYSYLAAAYFALESVYRLALAKTRGEPCGSVFGWVLVPFLSR